MKEQLEEETTPFRPSPLARPNEKEEDRIKRLLKEGTAKDCLIEANYWLEYYIEVEDAELEPVSTAMALNERAASLI
jgi:hypothetical protein